MTELPKTFDPAEIESRWYAHWETSGQFRPDRPGAEPWTIVNPPPNVTGSLHIGHALDNTLQDILVRHARLKGKDALWVVGTDHAGIATQMVVERQLNERQDKRANYTRDQFIDLVWQWKAESGGEITQQLRRLGCSMDWANERFTMDEGFSKAVLKVFVDLYNQKLIYRAKRLVNWDPELKTAISDLEVESREVRGHMWHFKYPLAGGETYTYVERDADGQIVLEEERDYISIATTRPETMLGDGAVAVHPGDARYAPIVGRLCEIPVGPKEHRRLIPIITDDYPDPNFGSGAVKITGAHDENDYGVAQRNGIPMYRLMDEHAAMRADGAPYVEAAARAREIAGGAVATAAEIDTLNLVPEAYRGLDRYEARKRVVADIDADGLMITVEDKVINQPFGDRSGVVIEPMLTDQWYVDAETLAKGPIEAVKSGAIKIVPKSWEKTFFNWMENIQPWCVSRQLWWGHRIPAWFGPEPEELNSFGHQRGPVFVGLTDDEIRAQAAAHYGIPIERVFTATDGPQAMKTWVEQSNAGATVVLWQDSDVLDTWFSSALWPFATMGWPDDGEWQHRYPNDVLISGFDILFFWDARMMMQGMHFLKDVPFRTLYLHGLVRAADGQKMSKSKGNVVNPLGLIDQFGADALRFFMAAMESQGRDIKMDEKRVEGYRNFATKLWNAARFCQSNGIGASTTLEAPAATLAVNKWIIGETIQTVQAVDLALADYRFDGAANAIYQFAWSRFCDWYIELIKPVLGQMDAPATGPEADETRAVAGWVLDQILVLLHPFMPFITEELWSKLGKRDYDLIVAKWPIADAREIDPEAGREINRLIETIEGLRSERLAVGFKPVDIVPIGVLSAKDDDLAFLNGNIGMIGRMARVAPAIIRSPGNGPYKTWGCERTDRFEHSVEFSETSFVTAQLQAGGLNFVAWTEGFIDIDAERTRLTKAIEAAVKERDGLAGRLNNPSFVERAKPEAVEKARADHAEKSAEADRLSAALARLG